MRFIPDTTPTSTRILMTACALMLAALGVAATFLPAEIIGWLGTAESPTLVLLVQILGALYFGFAMVDWTARDNLIGGIYSRPVALGNFAHFFIAGLALIKGLSDNPGATGLWVFTIAYVLFAAGFTVVLFGHPLRAAPEAAVVEPN